VHAAVLNPASGFDYTGVPAAFRFPGLTPDPGAADLVEAMDESLRGFRLFADRWRDDRPAVFTVTAFDESLTPATWSAAAAFPPLVRPGFTTGPGRVCNGQLVSVVPLIVAEFLRDHEAAENTTDRVQITVGEIPAPATAGQMVNLIRLWRPGTTGYDLQAATARMEKVTAEADRYGVEPERILDALEPLWAEYQHAYMVFDLMLDAAAGVSR
jgi:hypothetical protein